MTAPTGSPDDPLDERRISDEETARVPAVSWCWLVVVLLVVVANVLLQGWNDAADPVSRGVSSWWPFAWSPRSLLPGPRKKTIVIGPARGPMAASPISSTAFTMKQLALLERSVRGQPALALGTSDDPTGQGALDLPRVHFGGGTSAWVTRRIQPRPAEAARELTLDAWRRPLLYRCPGPVHTNGWDLYSVGANRVDERGFGDDLVVGEDIALVGSSR